MKHILLAVFAIVLIGCVEEKKSELSQDTTVVNSKYHPVEVVDVIPGGGYIYIKALENNDTIWLATTPAKLVVGETYYYTEVMEMVNFKSKELDRTFDKIYFLDRLLNEARDPLPGETHAQTPAAKGEKLELEAEEGVTTIGELFKNRTTLAGQQVTVKGKVTKVNNGIMDRNWVHLQDGTSDGDDFDLTITTNETVQLGAIVKFTGTVAVDKDFTQGYKYKLLLEEATFPDVEM